MSDSRDSKILNTIMIIGMAAVGIYFLGLLLIVLIALVTF